MTVVHITALASLAGAALFFASGYLARALRLAAAEGAGDDAQQHDELSAKLRATQSDLHAAQGHASELERTVQQLQQEYNRAQAGLREAEQLRSDNVGLREQLATRTTVDKSGTLAAELAETKRQLQNAQAKEKELASAKQQLQAAQAKEKALASAKEQLQKAQAKEQAKDKELASAKQQLQAAQAREEELASAKQQLQAAQAREEELARTKAQLEKAQAAAQGRDALEAAASQAEQARQQLEGELADLREQVSQLQRQAPSIDEKEELERRQRRLDLAAKQIEERSTRLEEQALENTQLHQQLADFEFVQSERDQLERRTKELEARLFAAGVHDKPKITKRASPAPGADGTPDLGRTMDEHLDALLKAKDAISAVLADSHGLLVAASGDENYHEALGVLSSRIGEVGANARDILPIAAMSEVAMTDEYGVRVSTRLLHHGDQTVSMTLLGTGWPVPEPVTDEIVSTLAGILEE